MGKNNDERRTEHGSSVFNGAEGRGVDEITGVSRDKEFADAVAAKDQLWRHTAIRAADDGSPRRLVCRHFTPLLREIDGAKFWMVHIAFVARFQRGERLGARESGRRTLGCVRLPRHAVEPKGNDARGA